MKKEKMYELIELHEKLRKEQNLTVNKYAYRIKISQSTYYNLVHKNIDIRKIETKTFLKLLSALEKEQAINYLMGVI